MVGDLVSVLVCFVDVIGKGGVLWEEVDDKFKDVCLEGVF